VSYDPNGRTDVFVKDLQTGAIERNIYEVVVEGGGRPAISADERYVAFESGSALLREAGSNGNVYVWDRQTQALRVVSRPEFLSADGSSSWGSLSADGQIVAFASSATNLVTGDVNNIGDVFDSVCGHPGSVAPTPSPSPTLSVPSTPRPPVTPGTGIPPLAEACVQLVSVASNNTLGLPYGS